MAYSRTVNKPLTAADERLIMPLMWSWRRTASAHFGGLRSTRRQSLSWLSQPFQHGIADLMRGEVRAIVCVEVSQTRVWRYRPIVAVV